MTNIVLVLVEETGAVIDKLLMSKPIYQLTFVTPKNQRISEFDILHVVRRGIFLKDIPREYRHFADKGYIVKPIFENKEMFYLEMDKYDD